MPPEANLPAAIAWLSRRQHVLLRRRQTKLDLAFLVERIIEADPELAKGHRPAPIQFGTVPHGSRLPPWRHFVGRAG
jgi:hypothetical protein